MLAWKQDGNSGLGLMLVYRQGSFNAVLGIGSANVEYRGSTFSAGSGGISWFIENNTLGGRLSFKNNLGFDISVTVWAVTDAANIT